MRDKKLREILEDRGILYFTDFARNDNYADLGDHLIKIHIQASDIRRINKKIESLLDYLGLEMTKIEVDTLYKITKKSSK